MPAPDVRKCPKPFVHVREVVDLARGEPDALARVVGEARGAAARVRVG